VQDFDGALKHDQHGLEVGREHHVLEAEANSLINLGLDYDHTGHSENTLLSFSEAESIFERDAWFRWRYNIRLQSGTCEHWLAKGDTEKARQFALRALETATSHEAHKYIAVAHKLLGQLAVAEGDVAEADSQFADALEELRAFPAPLVAWKTYAEIGRIKSQVGDSLAAREAFAEATKILNSIAANIDEEELRATFLNSPAVRQVVMEAASSASSQ
jgi:tetratricopeptide (TPR) repeat protein